MTEAPYRHLPDPACIPERPKRPWAPSADECTACRGTGWSIYEDDDVPCHYGHPDPLSYERKVSP